MTEFFYFLFQHTNLLFSGIDDSDDRCYFQINGDVIFADRALGKLSDFFCGHLTLSAFSLCFECLAKNTNIF